MPALLRRGSAAPPVRRHHNTVVLAGNARLAAAAAAAYPFGVCHQYPENSPQHPAFMVALMVMHAPAAALESRTTTPPRLDIGNLPNGIPHGYVIRAELRCGLVVAQKSYSATDIAAVTARRFAKLPGFIIAHIPSCMPLAPASCADTAMNALMALDAAIDWYQVIPPALTPVQHAHVCRAIVSVAPLCPYPLPVKRERRAA